MPRRKKNSNFNQFCQPSGHFQAPLKPVIIDIYLLRHPVQLAGVGDLVPNNFVVPLIDLHMLFGSVCALAELQSALPGMIITEKPLRLVLDRRPFI